MDDPRLDAQMRNLWEQAQPEMPPGWQERARQSVTAARVEPRRPRLQRVATVLGVTLVLLAVGFVPYSANDSQARMASALAVAQVMAASEAEQTAPEEEPSAADKMLAPYRRRAVEFVKHHHPTDPELLMAAGLLTEDEQVGLELLRKAVAMRGPPALWAAYLQRLMEAGPGWVRPAEMGGDPADPKWDEYWQQLREDTKLPDRIPGEQAAPILKAARAWQQADPRNAMPVMVEFRYLYALHRDAEAFARWREAGRLPQVEDHTLDMSRAITRLLIRQGVREEDAVMAPYEATMVPSEYSAQLRGAARTARVEGRWAQLRGRPKDAIAWWEATMELGRHLQESSTSHIGVLVGIAIEGIGAAPTWKWHLESDRATAPILGGRIYYGPQHAFYVSQVGDAADRLTRDCLVRSKVRSMLLREQSSKPTAQPRVRWGVLLSIAGMAVGMLVVFLLVFAAISLRHRRETDEATELSHALRVTVALVGLLPMAAGMVLYWMALDRRAPPAAVITALIAGLAAWLLTTVTLPLFAAFRTRRSGARLTTAWRGNLRKMLPVAMLVCALLALGFTIAGRHVRGKWIRQYTSPGYSEIARLKAVLGPKWDHPPVPPDAWRAENPPVLEQQSAATRGMRGGLGRRGGGGRGN